MVRVGNNERMRYKANGSIVEMYVMCDSFLRQTQMQVCMPLGKRNEGDEIK